MRGSDFAELKSFAAIVEHGSFVRAAAHLNVTPSALSQTIRALEERLGVRLLHRTTRSVSASAAGERLFARLAPALSEIDAATSEVHDSRGKASGLLRINAAGLAAVQVLAPILPRFYQLYPEILLEVVVDDVVTDVVAKGFDAGIRLGERLDKDMVALRVSSDLNMVAVASPEYLAVHGTPKTPKDLLKHSCINGRMPTLGNIYHWEFEKGSKQLELKVTGPLISNNADVVAAAALAGLGIAYCIDLHVRDLLHQGRFVQVLNDWKCKFPGFYLYYPGRKHPSAALRAFIDFLKSELPLS